MVKTMWVTRVLYTIAVLFCVSSFGTKNVRAQGSLGFPEWLEVGGLGDRYHPVYPATYSALFFYDPIHGIAATTGFGSAHIYYIANKVGFWKAASIPPGFTTVRAIHLIQGKLYAATDGPDILVSSDSGKNWKYAGLGLSNGNDVYADASGAIRVLTDPMKSFARLDTLHCVANGNGSIFISSDGGLTWNSVVTRLDSSSTGAFADRCQNVYLCPSSWGTALRSTDFGLTWRTIITGSGPFFEYLADASTTSYISTDGGLYRSTNDGITWTSIITVNEGPHWPLFVFGPMGEHVVMPWTFNTQFGILSEVMMTTAGGDDNLHSGVNMTDSNGMMLLENDTLNMPLRLTSRCNAYSIPIPFLSDVDSMTEHVSIVKDSLGDFAIVGPSTITLPRGRDRNFLLAYNPHHPVSTVELRFDNHWHCSDWSETRTVIVTSMPAGQIVPPPPFAGNCKPMTEAAFLKIDSCQTLVFDSVYIPPSVSSRLHYDGSLPDTVRAGVNDSLFFTFNPKDTIATISDSVEVFAHFLGIDSNFWFWDFGRSYGMDTDFSVFHKFVPVRLFALPHVALLSLDSAISLERTSFCERQLDTNVLFTNNGCTPDTIVNAILTGPGYSMPAVSLPIILAPDSAITFTLHFGAPDTGVFQGALNVQVISGETKILSIPLTGVGFPHAGILDVRSTVLQAGSFSFCGGDTAVATSISNVGCDTLRITNIRVSGDAAFAYTSSMSDTLLAPNATKPFSFYFAPRTKGPHSDTLTLHSQNIHGNDVGHDTTIVVDGMGLGGFTRLSSSLASADFGWVFTCQQRDTVLWLRNTGCDTLTVSSGLFSNPSYRSNRTYPIVMAPNDSTMVRVHLSPDTTGHPLTIAGGYTYTSDAQQGGTGTVPLQAGISYPALWSLSLSQPDSAYAGKGITYQIVQYSPPPPDVTAVDVTVSYDDDLLQFVSADEASVSKTNYYRGTDGRAHDRFHISPVGATPTLATLHFSPYLTQNTQTAITLDSIRFSSNLGRPDDCIASVSTAATAFTLREACGSGLIAGYMQRGVFLLDGIAPNPATGTIAISYRFAGSAAANADVSFEDALGRTVLQRAITLRPGDNSANIDLEKIPTGVYLVRITGIGFGASRKIVRE